MHGHQWGWITMGTVLTILLLTTTASVGQERRHQAPELRGQGWLNTLQNPDQLRLARLKGQVVVLLFFVTDDPNSLTALDQARQLWDAYRYRWLEVVGVHSPPEGWNPRTAPERLSLIEATLDPRIESVARQVRLELLRRMTAVQDVVERHQVPFPILVDHDRALWTRYRNLAYPTIHVIDHEGLLRATVVGTQSYQQLSQQVDALLSTQARIQEEQARNAVNGPPVLE